MSEDPKLDAIISLLYESVLDPNLLKEALGLCGVYANANDAMIMTFDRNTDLPISAVLAETSTPIEAINDYVNHYMAIDPRTYINKAGIKEWRCCHEINDQHFVNHNEFYQDYLIPYEARYLMVTRVYEDNAHYTLHALSRNFGQSHFDTTNVYAANRFFDHLQRTLRLHKQTQSLQAKIDLGAMAIDNLPISMIITNNKSQIEHLNSQAEKLLIDSKSGLKSTMGILVATPTADRHKLTELISNATKNNGQGGQMLLNSENPKTIFVTPITPKSTIANNWQIPLALILISEGNNETSQLELFKNLYHFTPAELLLVKALLSGKSVDNFAQERGLTINTIRSQLSALFKKTNTSRQGELIALLKSFPTFF